jgi:DNA-binding transcriptional LysR family regulator
MLMAVELDHVEAFVTIVRRGGFTRASSTLHLSQPAISRRVHLLERELGAPVFERIRSGVVLTEAGRAFLPHAEAILASMRDGLDSIDEEVRAGTLHVLPVAALRPTIAIVLIHRRRAYLSGAARALMAMLADWPATARRLPSPSAPSSARGARRRRARAPSPASRR